MTVNPTAPSCNPSRLSCRRPIWNTMSSKTAQERQLRLEAQALRQAQEQEQQAAIMTHEHELAIQEFRRQAEEQPELHKLLWRRQLSQQSTYKAEIHELYTEMINMREKSEMQSHLSAHMCKMEHTSPSRSLESEPDNVLNTASPSRSSAWILPSKMPTTPDRPTSSGLQSPSGIPVQLGPSPLTQEYCRPSPCCVPPARWVNTTMLENPETKNVNCLAMYLQDMKRILWECQQSVRRTRTS